MLKLGIAGIGVIANDYIQLIASGRTEGVEIAALCSRSYENMNKAKMQHHLENTELFEDYTAMLKSGLVEAVLICTPHPQHPEMTRQALECGIHVLVEKPVGVRTGEVVECIRLLESKPQLVCGVMYDRRMSTVYQKVKQMMEQGAIGKLKRVSWLITNLYRTNAYYRSSPWRGKWESEGGGVLMTQASHQLDLLQWLCGAPQAVFADCNTVERDMEVENDATILMRFANGASGLFVASAHEYPGSNRLEISGSKGRLVVTDDSAIEYSALSMDEQAFAQTNEELFGFMPYTTETMNAAPDDNKMQQAAMICNFASAIRGEAEIACPLKQGLVSLQMIQSAYTSVMSQQWTELK